MSDRKQVARRFLQDVLGAGRFELLPELVTADYADRSLPSGITPRQAIESFRAGFPDATVTIDSQVEEGDTVVTRWTVTATHTGDFFGLPASGRPIVMSGFSQYRFDGPCMAESWVTYDQRGLLQQIGAPAA
jgi:predicted ester cyclase